MYVGVITVQGIYNIPTTKTTVVCKQFVCAVLYERNLHHTAPITHNSVRTGSTVLTPMLTLFDCSAEIVNADLYVSPVPRLVRVQLYCVRAERILFAHA